MIHALVYYWDYKNNNFIIIIGTYYGGIVPAIGVLYILYYVPYSITYNDVNILLYYVAADVLSVYDLLCIVLTMCNMHIPNAHYYCRTPVSIIIKYLYFFRWVTEV